jgi:hypothetical protein
LLNFKSISNQNWFGDKKQTITRVKRALQPSQLPIKKDQITGQLGHQLMTLPTPDPFLGRQHATFKFETIIEELHWYFI